jgi:hypothetical protein
MSAATWTTVLRHAGARRELGAGADGEVIRDAGLAADHHAGADGGRAGDARHEGEAGIADRAARSERDSVADHRMGDGAVDADLGIGADLAPLGDLRARADAGRGVHRQDGRHAFGQRRGG